MDSGIRTFVSSYTPETQGLMVVFCGPSGAGKTTVEKKLQEEGYLKVISTTDRKKRKNEKNGRDYHFVHPLVFRFMDWRKKFFETTEYNGSHYGAEGRYVDPILNGAKRVFVATMPITRDLEKYYQQYSPGDAKELLDRTLRIQITVKNRDTLERRLVARGEDAAKINARLDVDWPFANQRQFHNYDQFLTNEDGQLDATMARVREFIGWRQSYLQNVYPNVPHVS